MKILKFIIEKNPFIDQTHLMKIKPAEVADNTVNVYYVKELVRKL